MDRRTLHFLRPGSDRRPLLPLAPSMVGPAGVCQFRLTNAPDESSWLGDGMGDGVDPQHPPMDRRELLVRMAIAGIGLAVGGAINALSMALARRSLDARVPEPSVDARH